MCEAWKFPKSFANVAGHHHDPSELPPANRPLATIVHIADRLVAQLNQGFRADLMTAEIDAHLVDELGLGFEHVEAIKTRLPQAIKEVEATFAG